MEKNYKVFSKLLWNYLWFIRYMYKKWTFKEYCLPLLTSVQQSSRICLYHRFNLTELQIRGGIEDNSKIIFLISQRKHIL